MKMYGSTENVSFALFLLHPAIHRCHLGALSEGCDSLRAAVAGPGNLSTWLGNDLADFLGSA